MVQVNGAQREPSMEEILASIRRIIEDSDTTRRPDEAIVAFHQDAEVEAFREEVRAPAPRIDVLRSGDRFEPVEISRAPSPKPVEPEPEVEFDPKDFLVEEDDDLAPEEEPAPLAAAPADEPASAERAAPHALMSPEAGSQVAAAFGELSDAFAARSRRSYDQIAEEMLRPMLQEWLDNNLPFLVERLVREEIERIARGGPAS
ncbi:MAG: DUF2497 domain-containing protein [Mesorhizobium amorphae]|nr:MAG: DUF2497 domain-containing protein [Mesorhizobium amorphae]